MALFVATQVATASERTPLARMFPSAIGAIAARPQNLLFAVHGLSKTITLDTNALTLRTGVRPQPVAIAPKSSLR
jgi:hypothetical protein